MEKVAPRVASALIVDVVEDQAIETQWGEALLGHVGDLLGVFRRDGDPRRGHCEEQELALPRSDPLCQVHAVKVAEAA